MGPLFLILPPIGSARRREAIPGTVLSVAVGGVSVKGTALRDALSLASANFTVTLSDDTFTVITQRTGTWRRNEPVRRGFLSKAGRDL